MLARGAVKKSIAAMASLWLRSRLSQRLRGLGFLMYLFPPTRNGSFGDVKTEQTEDTAGLPRRGTAEGGRYMAA
jgi:hypothetical protein